MATKRRLGITKRVSLAGIADGWDDECYAIITKVTNRENFELAELDTSKFNERKSIEYQAKFVKDHFVNGQIMVINETGVLEHAPMTASDIDDITEIANTLFLAAVGSDIDPKAIPKEAPPADELPRKEATTETTSSTD
jgi:hypothetical protein